VEVTRPATERRLLPGGAEALSTLGGADAAEAPTRRGSPVTGPKCESGAVGERALGQQLALALQFRKAYRKEKANAVLRFALAGRRERRSCGRTVCRGARNPRGQAGHRRFVR